MDGDLSTLWSSDHIDKPVFNSQQHVRCLVPGVGGVFSTFTTADNNMWMNPLFRHSTALSAALDRLDRPEHSLLLDLKIVLVQRAVF